MLKYSSFQEFVEFINCPNETRITVDQTDWLIDRTV